MAYSPNTNKIDDAATNGLTGTSNSLAYRVHEIEKHFHGIERWYGSDGDNTMSTANNHTPFVLTSHAANPNDWGTAVKLSGTASADILAADFGGVTPVKYDLHRIMITAVSAVDNLYVLQIYDNDPATTGVLITEVPIKVGSLHADMVAVDVQMPRQAMTTVLYGRLKSEAANKTLSFTIGIHIYQG